MEQHNIDLINAEIKETSSKIEHLQEILNNMRRTLIINDNAQETHIPLFSYKSKSKEFTLHSCKLEELFEIRDLVSKGIDPQKFISDTVKLVDFNINEAKHMILSLEHYKNNATAKATIDFSEYEISFYSKYLEILKQL